MLGYRPASQRAVTNLTNWVEGTAALAREETAYLGSKEDLLCANAPADDALSRLEEFIETAIVRLSRGYRKVGRLRPLYAGSCSLLFPMIEETKVQITGYTFRCIQRRQCLDLVWRAACENRAYGGSLPYFRTAGGAGRDH